MRVLSNTDTLVSLHVQIALGQYPDSNSCSIPLLPLHTSWLYMSGCVDVVDRHIRVFPILYW